MRKNHTQIKYILIGIFLQMFLIYSYDVAGQKQDIKPTIEPAIFTSTTEITVSYDVTGNVLANLNSAWIWVWIPGDNTDAKYNVNPASDNTSLTDNAKFSKSTDNSKTIFSITFTPQDFFDGDISEKTQLGMLLKGNDWSDGQTTDHIANLTKEDEYSVILIQPAFDPVFVNTNSTVPIEALANKSSNFSLSVNSTIVDSKSGVAEYAFDHVATESEGLIPCSLTVTDVESQEDTTIIFNYFIREAVTEMPRPAGIIPGINYHDSDDTKATLCLHAPMKTSAYVLGEFNDFTLSGDNLMYSDGEYFWLEITGLTSGVEYAFQYLVDESVYVADPFADKILDPDDKWIPASIYPNLKSYPEAALSNTWHFNRLAIVETGQSDYSWKNDAYTRPEKDHLIIYELLVRDFFGENDRSYQNLIDTLTYFQNLGVNVIELMPVQEFNGNSSWGYNPTFMFAPDKAYGTKNALKDFIDAAHAKGIAVVLDIVFNHQDIPNPYVSMYFDFNLEKPTPENPWFNVDATHPFSVFFDMDHESAYTKHFMDTTLHYWINEYHVDGFRFDLSKGFTQTVSGNDVGKWGQKDQSRIDILTRMADKVWSYSPDTWLIMEHFADNTEEIILADYGMMLWGNMHSAYKETILGYHDNNKSNLEWGYAPERGWQNLNLVTYMESHDEERQMYEALQFGNSSGDYSVKDLSTALDRVKAASAFLYTVPGPKMFWQFGELGYDVSIEENGRTGEKPVLWSYYDDPERKKLHDLKAELIKFRLTNSIFQNGDFIWSPESEQKRLTMGNDEMKMLIIGNFGVVHRMIAANFPEPGTWYDFFTGESFDVQNTGMELSFDPGEFHIYTTKKIEDVKSDLVPWGPNFVITSVVDELTSGLTVYPNPVVDQYTIDGVLSGQYRFQLVDLQGRTLQDKFISIDDQFVSSLTGISKGIYQVKLSGSSKNYQFKLLKN